MQPGSPASTMSRRPRSDSVGSTLASGFISRKVLNRTSSVVDLAAAAGQGLFSSPPLTLAVWGARPQETMCTAALSTPINSKS